MRDFELLTNLSNVEVISVNLSVRERKRLIKQYGGPWMEKAEKDSRQYDFLMERFVERSYSGTKLTESGDAR